MKKLIASTVCDRKGTFDGLKAAVETTIEKGAKSLFILSCDNNDIPVSQLDAYLQTINITVFGGIFPQIICGTTHMPQGHIVCGLSHNIPVKAISLAGQTQQQWKQTLQEDCQWLHESKSLITLIDGLSRHIDPFIELLYDHLGPDKPVVGGGAGSLELVQKPCLLTNQGVLTDAVIVAGLPRSAYLGVNHGWQRMAGPFLVTKAEDNIIHTLNYEPAFNVYREAIESSSDHRFSESEFFSIAKTYPFGLEKLDEEILIRDPIAENDGSLVCVGRVPEHTMIYIMKGNQETLKQAAHYATKPLQNTGSEERGIDTFLFDCVSRELFLAQQFEQELTNIYDNLPKKSELVGALTLGEIASSQWGPIQFLNKTIVVCALREN